MSPVVEIDRKTNDVSDYVDNDRQRDDKHGKLDSTDAAVGHMVLPENLEVVFRDNKSYKNNNKKNNNISTKINNLYASPDKSFQSLSSDPPSPLTDVTGLRSLNTTPIHNNQDDNNNDQNHTNKKSSIHMNTDFYNEFSDDDKDNVDMIPNGHDLIHNSTKKHTNVPTRSSNGGENDDNGVDHVPNDDNLKVSTFGHGNDDDDDDKKSDNNSSTGVVFQFMNGIITDLQNRYPHYKNDWTCQSISTVSNATIYTFIIQLIPSLIFAERLDQDTNGRIGVVETILSSAIMGVIYSFMSGQPLVILGITGPVALLIGASNGLASHFQANYYTFYFWVCIWSGLLHLLSAMIGLVLLVKYVTPFTGQIFEFFIAITFIYSSLFELIEPIEFLNSITTASTMNITATAINTSLTGKDEYTSQERSEGYATLFLGLFTCYVAWTLHFAETWILFFRQVRVLLTAYNTFIACAIVTAISFIPGFDQTIIENSNNNTNNNTTTRELYGIPRVDVRTIPWDWQPTTDRPWLASPFEGISTSGIFGALIPGSMFFLLFIIDHNVRSILTQKSKYPLKKASAYHWDFFVVGLTFIPCAILGLPPGNGLIPQAPLHARALCTREYKMNPRTGHKEEIVTYIEEQRWSNLGQSLLMIVALLSFRVISWIPKGCLYGLNLYLGIGALHGNEIWERILLSCMMPQKRPLLPIVQHVPWVHVQRYTIMQVALTGLTFYVAQFASVGYLYPAVLFMLVPFRLFVISRLFPKESLQYLDPVLTTSSVPEQIIHKVRIRSFDSIDIIDEPHYGDVRHVPIHQHHHHEKDADPNQQQRQDLKHRNNHNDTKLSQRNLTSLGEQNNENIMNRYSTHNEYSNRHNHSHPVNAVASSMLVGGFEENSSMASSTLFPTNP